MYHRIAVPLKEGVYRPESLILLAQAISEVSGGTLMSMVRAATDQLTGNLNHHERGLRKAQNARAAGGSKRRLWLARARSAA